METSLGMFGRISDKLWSKELISYGRGERVFTFTFTMGTMYLGHPSLDRVIQLLWVCRVHSYSATSGYHVEALQMVIQRNEAGETVWGKPTEGEQKLTLEQWLRQNHYNPDVLLKPTWSSYCSVCGYPDELLVHDPFCVADANEFSTEREEYAAGRDAAFRGDGNPLDELYSGYYELAYEVAQKEIHIGARRPAKITCVWFADIRKDSRRLRRMLSRASRGGIRVVLVRTEDEQGRFVPHSTSIYLPEEDTQAFSTIWEEERGDEDGVTIWS